MFGVDRALVGVHADSSAVGGADAPHRYALKDPDALLLGHGGQGHSGVDRRGLAIAGQPHATDDPLGVEQRVAPAEVLGGDHVHVHVEGVSHAGAPDEFLHSFRVVGHAERSDLPETGGVTHLVLEGVVQLSRVGGQTGHVVGGPEAANEASRVPGGAAGQRVALQQDHVVPAQFSKVVGHAGADYATTDDDDLGPIGDLLGHRRRLFRIVDGGSDGTLPLDRIANRLRTLTPARPTVDIKFAGVYDPKPREIP